MAEQQKPAGTQGQIKANPSGETAQEGGSAMRPQHAVGAGEPQMTDTGESAEDREKARARSRGVGEDEIEDLSANTSWYVSNRTDDRTVLFERDPRHPGGEAFIGGATPTRAFRTTNIQRLVQSGEVIEVPEPKKTMTIYDPDAGEDVEVPHRKRPIDVGMDPGVLVATQPGAATPIGRQLDKDLWDEGALKEVSRKQRALPSNVPVAPGGTVPRQSDVDRPA